jgi:ferredoxin
MRVTVDQRKCIASGQCVLTAADVFDQREEDGTVVLLDAEPSPASHQDVREAAELCPSLAIAITE